MKKRFLSLIAGISAAILSCCSSTASLGAGAIPGKDYVTSLRPSADARQYFSKIGNKAPIERLTRANAAHSKSGVRFVENDGILIPPGVTISFYNKGYCLDPRLPAPVADEEYQLVPASALIPSELQGIYKNLIKRAAAGDSTVRIHMQGLVWALRTAGIEGGYASRLSNTQKRILDSCSSTPGEFERIHNGALSTNKLIGKFWELADSAVHFDVGKRRWKPSDFSSTSAFNSAINSQLDSLISQGSNLPIQRTGFNYGELESGIYTDIRGVGNLAFNAKIANSTNRDFIFYPSNYVGQVGSGSVFSASSKNTQRQRVTMGPVDQLNVLDKNTPQVAPTKAIDYESLPCSDKAKYLEMARLGQFSYYDNPQVASELKKDGYSLEKWNINNGGLTYAILKKGDVSYITFRGTTTIEDGLDDANILFSGKNLDSIGQFITARQVVQNYMNEHPGEKIVLIGHSLGGSTVQSVMSHLPSKNIQGYTFNSYGLPGNQGKRVDDRITDIFHRNDLVHNRLKNSRLYGKKQIVVEPFTREIYQDERMNPIKTVSDLNPVKWHSMDTLANEMKFQKMKSCR